MAASCKQLLSREVQSLTTDFTDYLWESLLIREICGLRFLRQLHLTQALDTPFDALQRRIGVTFLLDDIPLCSADRFAKGEESLPVDVALPEQGFVVGLTELLQVHGDRPLRIPV